MKVDYQTLNRAQKRRYVDIINAALKIFERDGFDAAKMIDIAREAEVAKGTLYLYFENKAELMEGVIQTAIIPTLRAADETAVSATGSYREKLTAQVKLMGTRMASREVAVLMRYMMSGNTSGHKRVIRFHFDNVIQQGLRVLSDTLNAGVAAGEFRARVGEIDPLVILGSQIYTAVWRCLFDEFAEIDAESLQDDLMDIIKFGVLDER